MIHLLKAQNDLSIENNLTKVTGSLAMLLYLAAKLASESFATKFKLRENKAQVC